MTVANNLTDISLCESLTNFSWTGGPVWTLKSLAADDIPPIEGTYMLGTDLDIETGYLWFDVNTAFGGSQNYIGRHFHAWIWVITAGFLDIQSNGGIQLTLQDSSGNEGYWYVGGRDTYVGGWAKFIIDCDSQPTSNNGTDPTISSINYVGIALIATAKSKLGENVLTDLWQWGFSSAYTLSVTGGTSGTPLTWEDILTDDQALAKPTGIIQKYGGIYYLQGSIRWGDTGTGNTYFINQGNTVVWLDTLCSAEYYNLSIIGNGTGITSFVCGNLTGTGSDRFGYGGGTITSAGLHRWTFDSETNKSNIDYCKFYGVNLKKSGILKFNSDTISGTDREQQIISCTFDECDQLQYNEAEVINNYFLNYTIASGTAISGTTVSGAIEMLDDGDDNFTYNVLKNCQIGIYFPLTQSGTRDLIGIDMDATYDFYNNSGSTTNINATSGSILDEDEHPDGWPVNVTNTKTLTIRNIIVGSRFTVEKISDNSVIWQPTTATSSTMQKTDYNYTVDVDVNVKVRYSSGSTKYLPLKQQATITSTGMDTTVVQIVDDVA